MSLKIKFGSGYWAPREMRMGEWRKLHKEELLGLYHSPNINGVVKSSRLRLDKSYGQKEYSKKVINFYK